MLIPIFELFYEKKSGLRAEAEGLAISKTVMPFNASNQANITKDVSPYVTSIQYTDNEHGESDELSITFEDSENYGKVLGFQVKAIVYEHILDMNLKNF